MEEDNFKNLSAEDRCVHKTWKARVSGYEEVTQLFHQIDDDKSAEFAKYIGLIKKFVIDGNAMGQEKGLEASLAYIENYAHAGKTVGEVMSGIVAKGFAASKTRTRDISQQIALMYVEIERQDAVYEELMKGMDLKNPKIVAACVSVATNGLREFGSRVVSVKPLLKKVATLFADRDKSVRDEARLLAVEIYRWIGPVVKSQLSSLQPVQLAELELEFAKVEGQKATPCRYIRSQQGKQLQMVAEVSNENVDNDEGEESDAIGGNEALDAYEFTDPVDILAKLPKDFYNKLEEKNWKDRKEALQMLETLAKTPKLENGDYGELVRALNKIIQKDSNVICVTFAAKCIAALADGLKKRFHSYASVCVSILLDKFKEKKQNVVAAIREAIDAVYCTTNIEIVLEDVLEGLSNKNPSVKAETSLFLARAFCKTPPAAMNKKLLKAYTGGLIKIINEPDPLVRDSAAEALGTLVRLVGDKAIRSFIADVEKDPPKMAKVKEYSDKAVITKVGARAACAPAGAKSRAAADVHAEVVAVVAPSSGGGGVKVTKATTKVVAIKRRPANQQTNPDATTSRIVAKGARTKHHAAGSTATAPPPAVAKVTERELSEEEAVEIMTDALPMIVDLAVSIPAALIDTNWKTRLAAIEPLLGWLQHTERTDDGDDDGGGGGRVVPTQACVRLVCKKPGLKDTNFQVLKGRLDVIKYLAQHYPFSNTTAECCVNDIVEKLSDAKNNSAAAEVLTAIAEATHLCDVSAQAMHFAFAQKNTIVLQEMLLWMACACKEFGIANLNGKSLIEYAKKALSSNNASIRQAGVTLLGSLYLFMGANLHSFLENEKQALRDRINDEFKKYENEKPPTPIRGAKVTDSRELDNDDNGACAPVTNPLDSLPKVDISAQITDALLSELADKNWQVRHEALNKVLGIVGDARMIKASIGELPDALALRLVDSNTKIAQTALTVCEALAKSMSNAGRQHIRTLFPAFLQGLGDSKVWIRTSSISCINTFADQCGYKDFFESEMIHDALKSGSPTLRIELWSWLAEVLPKIKSVPKEELLLCVPFLYTNLEDRNADVRKNAGEAVLGMMIHLGYQTMAKQMEKLKPSSKPTVLAALEKTRPNLPERAPPVIKKAADDRRCVPMVPRASTSALAPKAVAKKTGTIPKQTATSRKKEEDVDTSPLLTINNLKVQRAIDETKLKVLKWNFTTPREEFVELLKEQMTTAAVNRTLMQNMFHSDFKFHIKAIESLSDDLADNSESLVANLDLILKWLTLRFFDTNPSVLLRGLEYLNCVFTMLGECNYHMLDNEAASFIPYLVVKVGDPKDSVRSGVRILLTHISNVYAISKLFSYLMEGLKSKNARQRAECLEIMGSMIGDYGMSVCLPSESACIKEIAKQISDRDNSVRNAALNCVVQAFYIVGERIYKLVGKISDKDLSLLEERIKRASKQRPSMPSNVQLGAMKPTGKFTLPPQVSPTSPGNVGDNPGRSSHGDHRLSRDDEEDYEGDVGEEGVADAEMMTDVNLPPHVIIEPEEFIGPFHLDEDLLRKLDSIPHEIHIPKLLKLDLDFLKDDDNIVMPTLEDTRRQLKNTQPPHTPKPPLPIQTLLSTVQHGHELMLLNIIANLASADIPLASQAFDQMLAVLQSPKAALLANLEDQFMAAIGQQLQLLFALDPRTNIAAMRLYKALLTVVDSFYATKMLGRNVTMAVLKEILMQFIKLLFEAKFNGCPNGDMFIRVINIHSVKIIERSDRTAMVCCLVQLLGDCLRTNQHERIVDLAMKCLWRVIRLIPKWADDLTFDNILLQIHQFLREFPSAWWKSRDVDTPLRTIKTVLHSMTKIKGAALMLHLSLIPNRTESEMEAFILKLLKSLKLEEVKAVPLKGEATSATVAPTSPAQHAHNKSAPGQHCTEDGKNWSERDYEHLKGPEYYQQFLDNFLKDWDEKVKRFYDGDVDNST